MYLFIIRSHSAIPLYSLNTLLRAIISRHIFLSLYLGHRTELVFPYSNHSFGYETCSCTIFSDRAPSSITKAVPVYLRSCWWDAGGHAPWGYRSIFLNRACFQVEASVPICRCGSFEVHWASSSIETPYPICWYSRCAHCWRNLLGYG